MKQESVDLCLAISLAHASLNLKLDDELGTLHGLGFKDFTLLHLLARAPGGRMPVSELVRPMGVRLSAVTRQLIPLEKTGHVRRDSPAEGGGKRTVSISPAGRALVQHAFVTAEAVCTDAVAKLPGAGLATLDAALSTIARAEALRL